MTFDESAEEGARLHASDEGNRDYYCHDDTNNVGPTSRYLQVGGIGLSGEGLGAPGSTVISAQQAFQDEAASLVEKSVTPPSGHFESRRCGHARVGLAVIAFPLNDATFPSGFYAFDYDLITPNAQEAQVGAEDYKIDSYCPAGIVANKSQLLDVNIRPRGAAIVRSWVIYPERSASKVRGFEGPHADVHDCEGTCAPSILVGVARAE